MEILRIHLDLKNREPDEFNLDELAVATEDYTGADIREVVLMGLKIAYHAGEDLSTEHLLQAVPEVGPLSQTDPERVAAMTEWLDRHTKPAGSRPRSKNTPGDTGAKRSRRVAV
jgi:SpoVK/Ycf46/Vps4 family AAA+-type ATPase